MRRSNQATVDPRERVRGFLDDFGRTAKPEFFASLASIIDAYLGASNPHGRAITARLGFRIRLVVDACAVQRMLRRLLTSGSCQFLETARASIFKLEAPGKLDEEICEHAAKIARETGKSVDDVLAAYFQRVRPHVSVRNGVDGTIAAHVRETLGDDDDVDYVAVALERDTVGLVTYDKLIQRHGAVRTFEIDDLGPAVIAIRKQAIVFGLGTSAAIGGGVALAALLNALVQVPRLLTLCVLHWRLVLGIGAAVGGGYLIARALWPEATARLTTRARETVRLGYDSLRPLLVEARPFVLALVEESAARWTECGEVRSGMRLEPSWQRVEGPRGRPVRLTARYLSRCVLLAHGRPLHVREISSRVIDLGATSAAANPAAALRSNLSGARDLEHVGGGVFGIPSEDAAPACG